MVDIIHCRTYRISGFDCIHADKSRWGTKLDLIMTWEKGSSFQGHMKQLQNMVLQSVKGSLTNEIHQHMLRKAPSDPELPFARPAEVNQTHADEGTRFRIRTLAQTATLKSSEELHRKLARSMRMQVLDQGKGAQS
ncbi:hypothetical protein Taro_038650 [Colocasia esculenta]|uniref:Uncharacterized protein n=1 Tax=Colocasia esculenta TaxID=4460 RepID=A0A843W423_COLES|nr:hypothetical protein [Colocasia esculenta]